YQDRWGDVWLGTSNGIARISGDELVTYASKDGIATLTPSPVIRDQRGNIWAGNEDGVLQMFAAGRLFRSPPRKYVLRSSIQLLYEQRDGTMWTADGGSLYRIRGGRAEAFGNAAGLVDSPRVLCETAGGMIWVGTSSGLQLFGNGRFGPVL